MPYADHILNLPFPILRAFAIQDPVEAAGAWVAVPVALWIIAVLGFILPPLIKSGTDFIRGRTMDAGETTLLLLLAVAAGFYAFPSSASKSGGTNAPPAAASAVKRINLYYQDADGRLVPLGAQIKEKNQ